MHKAIKALLKAFCALACLAIASPSLADPPPWAPAHGWRKKHEDRDDREEHEGRRYEGYEGRGWDDDYGVVEGRCNRRAVGAVLGSVVGGAIGSQVGSGDGRAVAIVVGAALGSLVGSEIGRNLDEADRGCIGHALELAGDNRSVHWVNDARGISYALTPMAQLSDDRACRRFRLKTELHGRAKTRDGVACRSGDGVWEIR